MVKPLPRNKKDRRKSDRVAAPGKARGVGTVLRGLQFKWTGSLTVIVFAVTIASLMRVGHHAEQLVVRQQKADALQQSAALGARVAGELRNNDVAGLRRIAEKLDADASLLYVEFFDSIGRLISERNRGTVAPPSLGRGNDPRPGAMAGFPQVDAPPPPAPVFMDVIQEVSLSAPGGGQQAPTRVGYIRVGLDLSGIQTGLAAFLENVRYAVVGCVLLMIPLAFMIVRRVTAPINQLSDLVTRFSSGDRTVRASIRRSDEVGRLAASFNIMANEISTKQDEYIKLNATLEARVQERTRQLQDLSERDPLTGLYNRRHLSDVLTRRFAEIERYGNDLSCMMIDLDNFKKVNDQYGHEMGDKLLILTATVIQSQLRGADVGARFGGDEFCILLPQTSAEQAQQVGARIVETFQVELRKHIPDHGTRFGISVGVAGARELSVLHPDELVKASDNALYGAKEAGKNCIHMASVLA